MMSLFTSLQSASLSSVTSRSRLRMAGSRLSKCSSISVRIGTRLNLNPPHKCTVTNLPKSESPSTAPLCCRSELVGTLGRTSTECKKRIYSRKGKLKNAALVEGQIYLTLAYAFYALGDRLELHYLPTTGAPFNNLLKGQGGPRRAGGSAGGR
jgi:hypothetical protein